MKDTLKIFFSVLSLSLFVFASAVCASSLDNVQIIKISSRDQQAIIKMEDGKMRVVKVGEIILDNNEIQGAELGVQSKDKEVQSSELKVPSKDKDVQSSKFKRQSNKAKIVEITSGRIVLEEVTKDGPETIVMRQEKKVQSSEFKVQSKGEMRTTAPYLIYKFTKIINNKGLSIC
jgi:Tfp pilus assembly protein PilP